MPDRRATARRRFFGDEGVHDFPERPHIVFGDAVVIGLADGLDIVFGAWFAVAGFTGGGDRHGCPPEEFGFFTRQYKQCSRRGVATGWREIATHPHRRRTARGIGRTQVFTLPPSTAMVCPV